MESLSHVRLFATPWTAAHQAPPSMGFSRQEYWSGLPSPYAVIDQSCLPWPQDLKSSVFIPVPRKVKSLSRVQLFATPWTAAHQAPPSMGFSRQEYWSGLPLPSPKLRLETCKDLLGVPQPVKSGVQVLAQTDLPWETGII